MNETRDDRNAENGGAFERMGEALGGAAGRAMGRGGDMAAGMLGSALGTALDSLGEWWSSRDARQAAGSFSDSAEASCRRHFEDNNPTDTGRSYEGVRPLYQFGYTARQNPSYRGRDFREVEADLQRAWSEDSRQRYGDWPEVSGYVGFGFAQEGLDNTRGV